MSGPTLSLGRVFLNGLITTYNAYPSGRGMHPSYGTEGHACADIRGDQQVYSKRQLTFRLYLLHNIVPRFRQAKSPKTRQTTDWPAEGSVRRLSRPERPAIGHPKIPP